MKHPFNCRIITCGVANTGKTAFLEKLINNTILTDYEVINDNNSNYLNVLCNNTVNSYSHDHVLHGHSQGPAALAHNNKRNQIMTISPANRGNFLSNSIGTHATSNVESDRGVGNRSQSYDHHLDRSSATPARPSFMHSLFGFVSSGSSANNHQQQQPAGSSHAVGTTRHSSGSNSGSTSSNSYSSQAHRDQSHYRSERDPRERDLANMLPSSNKEDIYLCTVNSDRGPAIVRIHDTPGRNWSSKNTPPRHYCHFGDGFLIFFDLSDADTFKNVDFIKNEIFKERDRKEVHIALVGMKSDKVSKAGGSGAAAVTDEANVKENLKNSTQISSPNFDPNLTPNTTSTASSSCFVDRAAIQNYIEQEKLSFFECNIYDRSSLSEPVMFLINKMVAPVRGGLLSRRR